MFGSMQFQTATLLGLSPVIIVALQSSGAIGNMICINNVVAVTSTTNAIGSEGNYRVQMIPFIIYIIMTIVMAFLLL